MLISRCPRCSDDVRLPDHLSVDAKVQCPLCGEVFPFLEMDRSLPPMLRVVDPGTTDPGTTDHIAAGHSHRPTSSTASELPIADEPSAALGDASSSAAADNGVSYWEMDDDAEPVSLDDDISLDEPEPTEAQADSTSPVAPFVSEIAPEPGTDVDVDLEGGEHDQSADAPHHRFELPPTGEIGEELIEEHTPSKSEEQEPAGYPDPKPVAFELSRGPAPAEPSRPRSAPTRPRRRRQPKSPVVEMIKVVLGGLLALPAAQLILLWLPINLDAGQRDPVGAVPMLVRYAPFLVPATVKTELASAASGRGGNGSPKGPSKSTPGEDAVFEINPPNSSLPQLPLNEPTKGRDNDSENSSTEKKSSTEPGRSVDSTDSAEKMKEKEPAKEEEEPFATDFGRPNLPPEPAPLSPVVTDAVSANNMWDQTSPRVAATHMNLYRALAALGEYMATDEKGNAAAETIVSPMLREVAGNKEKRSILSRAAKGWMGLKDRPSDGIVFGGRIEEVLAISDWTQVQVTLVSTDNSKIEVVLRSSVMPTVGTDIFAVGKIVTDPQKNIPGYTGESSTVIQVGALVPLAAE